MYFSNSNGVKLDIKDRRTEKWANLLKLNIFLWRILIDPQILYSEPTRNPSRL